MTELLSVGSDAKTRKGEKVKVAETKPVGCSIKRKMK